MILQMTLYEWVCIACNLFVLYIIKRFMNVFFPVKENQKTRAAIFYFLYFIVISLLDIAVDIPFAMLISNLILLFLISSCYDTDLKNRIFSIVYMYLVMFSVEVIMTALTWSAVIEPFDKFGYKNEMGRFISTVLEFLIVLLIENILHLKRKRTLPLWMLFATLSIPVISIIIEIVVTRNIAATQATVIISMTSLFIMDATVFLLYDSLANAYDRQLKAVSTEQERSYYLHQCRIMQAASEDARNFRHDINNHLMLLQKMLNDGNIENVRSYLSELTRAGHNLKQIFSTTGNIVIDSIINYKLGCITRPDMDLQVEANVPTDFSIEIMDLSIILTNLLDNAIQASTIVEDNPKLYVKIIYKKGMLLIRIINSYNGEVRYENGEMISTKDNKIEHGRGLKNVKNALEKYNGLLNVKHDSSVFIAEVVLYVNIKY